MTRTVQSRVGDWKLAFDVIREELTPPVMRTILAEMATVEGTAQLTSYMSLAAAVMSNDRAAAHVAAVLTQSGIARTVNGEE